jgi:hypothetical protein
MSSFNGVAQTGRIAGAPVQRLQRGSSAPHFSVRSTPQKGSTQNAKGFRTLRRGASTHSINGGRCTSLREGSTHGSEGTGCFASACRSPGTCPLCRRYSTRSRSGSPRGPSCVASSHTSGSGCVRRLRTHRGDPPASHPRPSRDPGRRASLPEVWRARRKNRTPFDPTPLASWGMRSPSARSSRTRTQLCPPRRRAARRSPGSTAPSQVGFHPRP